MPENQPAEEQGTKDAAVHRVRRGRARLCLWGIGIAGSLEHPPSKEQLQGLIDEAADLPSARDLDEILRLERFATLDIVQAFAHGNDAWEALGVADGGPTRWLGSHHSAGAIFGLRNGAAEFLSENIDRELLKRLLRGTNAEETMPY